MQKRDTRDCPECGAAKGTACRKPSCPQLEEAPNPNHCTAAALQETLDAMHRHRPDIAALHARQETEYQALLRDLRKVYTPDSRRLVDVIGEAGLVNIACQITEAGEYPQTVLAADEDSVRRIAVALASDWSGTTVLLADWIKFEKDCPKLAAPTLNRARAILAASKGAFR